MIRGLLLSLLLVSGCIADLPTKSPRSLAVGSECYRLFGVDFGAELLSASEYWVRRGYRPVRLTASPFAARVTCHDRQWPAGHSRTDRIKGAASRWHIDLLYQPAVVRDHETCLSEATNWRLSTLLIHELGHFHGLGHRSSADESDVMHPYAISYCDLHH